MAEQIYYSVFTKKGLELLTEAIRNGTKLGITSMAFGDGGGILPTPAENVTKLVKEVYRTQLNSLAPDPNNANWLRAEAVIASAIGGFNIRELGLYAGDVLVAYSNYPATYKPNPSDGTARIMTFRMVLQIDNTSNFDLVIDPDIVLATIQYVKDTVSTAIRTVEDYSQLRNYKANDAETIFVKKDGISGQFTYDKNSVLTPDDGVIIASGYGGNWYRKFEGAVFVKWFDIKNKSDCTAILQKISTLYENLDFTGLSEIYTSDTITIKKQQIWQTRNPILIKNMQTKGSAIKPMLDIKAKTILNAGFEFDHNATAEMNYIANTVYAENPIAGSCILIQADDSSVENITVRNAFDNGISIVQIEEETNIAKPSHPVNVKISKVSTFNCGYGTKTGAGIDNASGIATISSSTDTGSYTGFINDIGAGARGIWSDIVSLYPKRYGTNTTSGYGLYSGSPDSSFINITVIGAGYQSFWLDAAAINCRYTNLFSDAPQEDAFKIKSGNALLAGITCKNTGQKQVGQYDDIVIDSTADVINNLLITNLATTGATSRHGIYCIGDNDVIGSIIGAIINSKEEKIKLNSQNLSVLNIDIENGFLSFNKDYAGLPFDFYGRMRVGAETANKSSKMIPFGDSSNNGTFFIEDYETPSRRLAMGYDPVNDFFVMQAIHAGLSKKGLALNPAGGDVLLNNAWDKGCLRLGEYRLWIDESGNLRLKNGAPTFDKDGKAISS
ncbi:phage tail protein [Acinetobacter brisouii]|uniref:phage tail protein n=1 Tax=Acinetobacter brisouii TaxID=396323 RepID=UPI00124EB005|nr:phage tail protein [Acinetobacter brisouii]